jgi:hypothetical protein
MPCRKAWIEAPESLADTYWHTCLRPSSFGNTSTGYITILCEDRIIDPTQIVRRGLVRCHQHGMSTETSTFSKKKKIEL